VGSTHSRARQKLDGHYAAVERFWIGAMFDTFATQYEDLYR
jgi:uncharacterized protein YukE